MSALERLLIQVLTAVVLAALVAIGVRAYGAHRYSAGVEAGAQAAVDLGKKQRDRAAYINQQTEDELRALLAAKDANAYRKEQEYASNLEAAQRSVRAGTDRLRCPTGPVPAATAPADRPTAGAPAVDGGGPDLVPEASADVLGHGAAIAGIVSRYAEVLEDFEACRAVNAR